MLSLIVSNRMELLYESLKSKLFLENPFPFTKRIIGIPQTGLRDWLTFRFAQDPDIGIAMGIEMMGEEGVFAFLTHLLAPQPLLYEPSRLELSLALEKILREGAFEKLGFGASSLRSKNRRIRLLAEKLAAVFQRYGREGIEFFKEWKADCIQKQIWDSLFTEERGWSYPHKIVESLELKDSQAPDNLQVHLFGWNSLSPVFLKLLEKCSSVLPVTLYLLSPCQMYWEDLLSSRERQSLERYWRRRRATSACQAALHALLEETNPLLAQMGQVGRRFFSQLENLACDNQERYAISPQILELPSYAALVSGDLRVEGDQKCTLLSALQADLLLLRIPEKGVPFSLPTEDDSLQVHRCPSKAREVQILYDALLGILSRHATEDNPLYASDILILTPSLVEYAPYITALFNRSESQLKAHILGLSLRQMSAFVQNYFQLLELASSQWEPSRLSQLFNTPFFRQKHRLHQEDLEKIQEWMRELSLQSGTGEWKSSFYSLFHSLADGKGSSISFSELELLGKWEALVRALQADLKPLNSDVELSLEDWSGYLRCLCEAYLAPVDAESFDHRELLFAEFARFQKASKTLPEERFSFESIYERLKASLETQVFNARDTDLRCVRFSPLHAASAYPSRVVVLMGMEEESFPRSTWRSPLDLLGDTLSSPAEKERYLFLECLLAARDYLLISYVSVSSRDGKEQPPCLPLQELLQYAQTHFSWSGEPISSLLYLHPFSPFDVNYFKPDSRFKNYSTPYFRALEASKKSSPRLNVDFPLQRQLPSRLLELRLLESAVKNPVKFFLNERLKIDLPSGERRRVEKEEPLKFSPLEKYQLKKQALHEPLEQVIEKAKRRGMLPCGPFGQLAEVQLKEEVSYFPKESWEFHLTSGCGSPYEIRKGIWQVPPVYLDHPEMGAIEVTGVLGQVTAKGLWCAKECSLREAIAAFPKFLLLTALQVQGSLREFSLIPELIFLEEGSKKSPFFKDPHVLLNKWVSHYLVCWNQCCPLMADWVKLFLTGNREAVIKGIERDLTGSPYAEPCRYFLSHAGLEGSEGIWRWIDPWITPAQTLYGELAESWFSKKGKA